MGDPYFSKNRTYLHAGIEMEHPHHLRGYEEGVAMCLSRRIGQWEHGRISRSKDPKAEGLASD